MQGFVESIGDKRHYHFACLALQLLAQLHHTHRQNLLSRLIQAFFVLDSLPLHDAPIMHMQHADIHIIVLFIVAKHIYIAGRAIGDNGLAAELPQ